METEIIYMGYVGIVEKQMETTGIIGVILGLYRGLYRDDIGRMEATI